MPTPSQLRAEILAGPLAAELAPLWAAADDAGVAAVLNRRDLPGYVPIAELSAYCVAEGVTGAVLALDSLPVGGEIAPGVTVTLQVKGLLKNVLTLLLNDFRLEYADVGAASFGAALDGLIALGALTAGQKAALVGMGANRESRAAKAFGWGVTVSATQVGEARNNG